MHHPAKEYHTCDCCKRKCHPSFYKPWWMEENIWAKIKKHDLCDDCLPFIGRLLIDEDRSNV